MKFTIAGRERQVYKKYKKQNALLNQELSSLKRILVQVSNLVQPISAQSHFNRKKRTSPSKRLNHHRHHRRHRLSSSLVKITSSNSSLKSFVSIPASTHSIMNSTFLVSHFSNENEGRIDSKHLICGLSSPNGSDSGSSVYSTAKSSIRSPDDALEFYYDANDSYDADVEMSEVLMHGDKTINESVIHDENQSSPLQLQSQSVPDFTDFSFQSPHYVRQQTSDTFSDFDEMFNNEVNNNDAPDDFGTCVFFYLKQENLINVFSSI